MFTIFLHLVGILLYNQLAWKGDENYRWNHQIGCKAWNEQQILLKAEVETVWWDTYWLANDFWEDVFLKANLSCATRSLKNKGVGTFMQGWCSEVTIQIQVVFSNIFYVHPCLGKDPIWNHQLEIYRTWIDQLAMQDTVYYQTPH